MAGLATVLVMGALCCLAQNAVSNGSLAGVIQDSSGRALPGVEIALIDEDTGIRLTTKSNFSGVYFFPELAVGTYQAQFSLDRFRTTQITGLKISVGHERQDLAMPERLSSFGQPEILARPVKKISSGVVHELPAFEKSTYIRPESFSSMGGYYTARTQRVDMLD